MSFDEIYELKGERYSKHVLDLIVIYSYELACRGKSFTVSFLNKKIVDIIIGDCDIYHPMGNDKLSEMNKMRKELAASIYPWHTRLESYVFGNDYIINLHIIYKYHFNKNLSMF